MEIKRTANAGGVLRLDNVSVLLDGICGEIKPYFKTPETLRREILENLPNIVAFTHTHTDHFDKDFAALFSEKYPKMLVYPRGENEAVFGKVKIESVITRHIGMFDIKHFSFVISGSKRIWFMGDASPVTLKSMAAFEKPDVLFVPFTYFATESAFRLTKNSGAKEIVLLHMPSKEGDGKIIWEAVENNIRNERNIHIPEIGETIVFN